MREHKSASVHVHNPSFGIRNINGGIGTIEGGTFAGLAISKIPQKKVYTVLAFLSKILEPKEPIFAFNVLG